MGRTCNIDTTKFKLVVDGKPKRNLMTWEDLQEKIKELSPRNTALLNPILYTTRLGKDKESKFFPSTSLKQIIAFLTSIYDEYGDMPFLAYNSETGCYYNRSLYFFNVVSKYHLIGCNEKHQIMNVINDKAFVLEV